ncbi:MAG: twitching motility protein PilT [Methylotenera sp.]|nr:twitching motility protein PilT [Oligoflexia bacterium]
MKTARFTFRDELLDFIATRETISHSFRGSPSVKDVIEALGVPHVEVGKILLTRCGSQKAVSWDLKLEVGDEFEVEDLLSQKVPDFQPELRPELGLMGELRLVLDGHLGRLAAYLRLLGIDTHWHQHADDPDLAEISARENRILLTRDIGLLKRTRVVHGRWVRATDPKLQVTEVFEHFALLRQQVRPFTRCLSCNGLLTEVPKKSIEHLLLPQTRVHYEEFFQCQSCRRVYWKGPHFEKMQELISSLGHSWA